MTFNLRKTIKSMPSRLQCRLITILKPQQNEWLRFKPLWQFVEKTHFICLSVCTDKFPPPPPPLLPVRLPLLMMVLLLLMLPLLSSSSCSW
jgi:hypothetical protein